MATQVYLARTNYSGPDRLDVSLWRAKGNALAFVPWRKAAERYHGGEHSEERWQEFVAAYRSAMVQSYITRASRPAWLWALTRESVTVCCDCTDRGRCHCAILARVVLPGFGASFAGERDPSGEVP